jgi:hypothetical protein
MDLFCDVFVRTVAVVSENNTNPPILLADPIHYLFVELTLLLQP